MRDARVASPLYIDALRNPDAEAALLRFLERALPFTFLSAVVRQELAAGALRAIGERTPMGMFGP